MTASAPSHSLLEQSLLSLQAATPSTRGQRCCPPSDESSAARGQEDGSTGHWAGRTTSYASLDEHVWNPSVGDVNSQRDCVDRCLWLSWPGSAASRVQLSAGDLV